MPFSSTFTAVRDGFYTASRCCIFIERKLYILIRRINQIYIVGPCYSGYRKFYTGMAADIDIGIPEIEGSLTVFIICNSMW